MSDEIGRLQADLEALDEIRSRYDENADFTTLVNNMRARLEAEATDPWRLARNWIEGWKESDYNTPVVAYVDHLTAENDRLTARVAELEVANKRMRNALKRIAAEPDCGCVPCRDACRSHEALKIELQEIRETASIAIADDVDDILTDEDKAALEKIDIEKLIGSPDNLNDTSPPKFEIAGNRTVKYTDAGPLRPRDVSVEINDSEPLLLGALESLVMAIELPGEHCEVEQAMRQARAALQAAKGGGE